MTLGEKWFLKSVNTKNNFRSLHFNKIEIEGDF